MNVRAAALLALLGASGCGDPKVIRVVDGTRVEGRFIPYEAYARYGRAAEAEARGDLDLALALYDRAAESDPDSAEIWTRLGAVRCAIVGKHAPAEDAFERAEDIDPAYEPLWRERARCAAADGRLREAIGYADQALALDPNRDEVVLLYASLLERVGRVEEAERMLDALVIQRPSSVPGWLARYELALRRGDRVGAEGAARELRVRAPRLSERLVTEQPILSPLAEVDAAIEKGDLAAARIAARHARLPAAELAVRAAALGRADLARVQAELVLGADPASSSARAALAVAADLKGDTALLATALDDAQAGVPAPPSPLARLIFAELLHRRVGRDAARAFLGPEAATEGKNAPVDPLLAAVRKRVRARLTRA
jgi:tetratricopeptide (TPR) repeat protein